MKTVVLIRHAKSDKKTKNLRDIERPLNKRGLKDAPTMSQALKRNQFIPQLIITSPAERAMKTAKLIAKEMDINEEAILSDPTLYMESKSTMLNTIKQIDDKFDIVFLVSHNPGLTDLVNYISLETIENVPTTGIAVIQIDSQTWKEVDMGNGKMVFYETPKKQRAEKEKNENHTA